MLMDEFTYAAYGKLLEFLKHNGYTFCTYHDYHTEKMPCILRHDIDMSIESAYDMACFESGLNFPVKSTYFVLLKTDFYNPASAQCVHYLNEILKMGHEIGLHFDEGSYPDILDEADICKAVEEECNILNNILGYTVKSVSMHRPSRRFLEMNLNFGEVINSYGAEFFQGFKYLSDSRRYWREPPDEAINTGKFKKLHILTHPIWYGDNNLSAKEILTNFIDFAAKDRYIHLSQNIRNLDEILEK